MHGGVDKGSPNASFFCTLLLTSSPGCEWLERDCEGENGWNRMWIDDWYKARRNGRRPMDLCIHSPSSTLT